MSAEKSAPPRPPDDDARPRLYVVALAHLDTQWRWTVRDTAAAFLPRTARENEDRFLRFPNYRLNFEGAARYRLLEECHPELFARVRARVGEGRWFPSGAAWEAFDTNLPAPESIVRQILYGTRHFEASVGKAGRDLFLPDCFGFSQALPTLAAHCGILGFSTQKLRRGAEMRSAFGVPFPFGLWVGPDGATLAAVLDPGEYGAQATSDLASDPTWIERFRSLARDGRPARLMTYQGLGDKGGALPRATLEWLERARASGGPIEVRLADSEEIFRDLDAATRARLPVYDGELLLRLHATGCYSSRSQLKLWHRQAEQLAHAAERAAAIAQSLGLRRADRERIREAWLRILAHEMHDDLTGTSLVEAYRYSAADLALSMNELQQELEEAAGAVATALDADADADETALVVFNALGWERNDLVEVRLPPGAALSGPWAVFAPDGAELPSQWHEQAGTWSGRFFSSFPSLSFSRLTLKPQPRPATAGEPSTDLSADSSFLENSRLRVEIDAQGDISRIFDKLDRRELLAAPIGLEILDNFSDRFPSWEIRYEDTARPARTRVAGPVRTVLLERGPARVALTLERSAEGSSFTQTIALSTAGAGDHVTIDTSIRWQSDGALLKMVFPLSTPAEQAIYDQGVGVARRPVSTAELYEVPAHQWAALREDRGTGAGAAIANDCKYGWDHPDARTLRLTLLHTPRIGRRFRYQQKQDFGQHRVRVAIAPIRAGDSLAGTIRLAERINQPLRAFLPPAGAPPPAESGAPPRPKSLSFLSLDRDEAAIQAMKLAEDGDEIILRLRETCGEGRSVGIRTHLPLVTQRQIDGCERPPADEATPASGARKAPVREKCAVSVPLRRFGLAAHALTFDSPLPVISPRQPRTLALALPWNSTGVTSRGERTRDGGLDGRGRTVPRQLLPRTLCRAGVELDLSHAFRPGMPSVVRCEGQRLSTPRGYSRLVILAAAFPGELEAEFLIDGVGALRRVACGFAPLGRFDELERGLFGRPNGRVVPGFLRSAPVALAVPHRHDRRGAIDPCASVLFFGLELPVSAAGSQIVLPQARRLFVLAATLSDSPSAAAPALGLGLGEPR